MFKNKKMILNPYLNKLITELGHLDKIVVCDAGLAIPKDNSCQIIDLSIVANLPKFIDIFKIIMENLEYEKIILAHEINKFNPQIFKEIKQITTNIDFVDHQMFKLQSCKSKAFIRTAETTPYANAIIICGVNF